jgi:hypothetical protein
MTPALETCAGGGATEPVGALHLYRGAAIVLRCPHCDNTLAKIVETETRLWIGLGETRTLELFESAVIPGSATELVARTGNKCAYGCPSRLASAGCISLQFAATPTAAVAAIFTPSAVRQLVKPDVVSAR